MVAVRSAHLNTEGEFALDQWIASLGVANPHSCDRLAETWRYCEAQTQGHPHQSLLLWRGIEMVEILSMLSMDIESLCAALIFPLANDEVVSEEELEKTVGPGIVSLVHGVRDMDAIRQLKAIHNDSMASEQVDNVRRMLLAMVEDFRCVVLKLAERIMNLREVKDAPEDERVLAAKESTNIYAPLANRLGIGQLKWELEDYCFRYLHPDEYKRIAKLLHERRIDREQYIDNFVDNLRKEMAKEGVRAEVYGRPKHIYSIWRKMQKKSLAFDELFDVRAVRIVAERLQDCYGALGTVHTLYRHLPNEFDDYVANPKPNGYQSIHTVVLGPEGKTVEIQIRTRQMHEDAELGVAAHWKYKEGPSSSHARGAAGHEERIAWLRKLISWQEEMADSGELLEEVRSQVFDDRVYVFTPKGDVVDLPAGSTPLDFAYHIHSDIGHRCIGAKIGGRIVPFTYQLQMGDQVEVITQKQPNPSRDWLNPNLGFITTSRGRAKIHNWFRKQDRDKNILAGRQILDNELNQMDISLREAEKLLLPRYNVTSLDELLAAIGGGDIRLHQMVNFLQAKLNKPTAEEQDREALRQLTQKSHAPTSRKESGRVVVEGVGNLMHHIARCCQPIPGDDIVGFITHGRGISIHRADCDQLSELISTAPERIVDAVWGESYSSGYSLVVRVTANDRSGLLRDITTILANEKVNVLGVSSRSDTKKQLATIDMDIEIYNHQVLGRVLSRLNQVPDIIDARRLH
ncbi:GTP pyrophosphokinase [Pantoea sp. PA1]|jgi:GTP pyrophosphokinase|uniref:GTP pyrophosphokinase n=2 Tax=Pantoea ananas TaxID=553 RepID=D4GLJ2_PANAM|nr:MULTISPECIES: GTP diphosphokinase [Pantoea]ADD78245.1 RelA [Pantoea ananatis LMG 20103]AER31488.1 GTP pyrophosphokinase RelA [Pantoea ananatis PA13]AMB76955.1 (p)ppGpp synthetase [Pantoea ananatis]ASN14075.1 GTP diphosphokinase [Pantoea ananatis]ERM13056.1 GTP pyrophosphokinase [Pantoea ananatis BRT175]